MGAVCDTANIQFAKTQKRRNYGVFNNLYTVKTWQRDCSKEKNKFTQKRLAFIKPCGFSHFFDTLKRTCAEMAQVRLFFTGLF